MKIHRFIDNFDLTGSEVEITGEIAHQMAKVLKLEIGEQVELCDGKGTNALGKIKTLSKNSTIVEIESCSTEATQDKKSVSLFCAVLKKENFELVVQKATECGVDKIIPVITTRTIKMGLNMERLQKIAREACEQSHRSILPEVLEPISFEKSLEMLNKEDLNPIRAENPLRALATSNGTSIIFDASGEKFSSDLINGNVNIFIGPEGGWTPEELETAQKHNFKIFTLGKNILRGETAAIVATYCIVNK